MLIWAISDIDSLLMLEEYKRKVAIATYGGLR